MPARPQHGDGATREGGGSVTLTHQALRREVNEQIHRINRSMHTSALGSIDARAAS